jgi:predicted kinase
MSNVFVLIGIPASGKTTWLWEQKLNPTFPVLKEVDFTSMWTVSSDQLRYVLAGDESDQSKNQIVWREFYKAVKTAVSFDHDVITDSTSAKASDRKKLIAFSREHGAQRVHGIFFNTSLEICKERNLLRPRVVPEYVIERMFAQIEADPPRISDGFDTLNVIQDNHVRKHGKRH